MTRHINVEGVLSQGGTVNVTSSAVGHRPNLTITAPGQEPHLGQETNTAWDVGVITILPEETQAVALALSLKKVQRGNLHFYESEAASKTKVAACQALVQGEESVVTAWHNLTQHYAPRSVVLAGIGGGIRPGIKPGDVVVATRVVSYDLRKETSAGTQHRGAEYHAPAEVTHAVNAFFADHDPAEFSVQDPAGTTNIMRMRQGIIGSGNAVVADYDSGILRYLASFNDKILAIDMEAAGLSQAAHEHSASSGRIHGWAVIRGISDDAGPAKDDKYHRIASWHAAQALGRLLPYLPGATERSHRAE